MSKIVYLEERQTNMKSITIKADLDVVLDAYEDNECDVEFLIECTGGYISEIFEFDHKILFSHLCADMKEKYSFNYIDTIIVCRDDQLIKVYMRPSTIISD